MSPFGDVTIIEMSPNLEVLPEAPRLGRTAMSSKEMRRAGVLARVESGELTLVDAAVLTEVRHEMVVKPPKSFKISSGCREVCTTF